MKRCVILAFLFLLFSGCQAKSNIEVDTLAMEPEIFRYAGTERVCAIDVDENGLLYTCSTDETMSNSTLSVYDWDGNCLQQVSLGSSLVQAILVEEGTLYAVMPRKDSSDREQVLAAIDLTTWERTELAVIPEKDYYSGSVSKIVAIGDYFYLFGISPMGEDVSYNLLPNISMVPYYGTMISRISRVEENPSVEFFDVDMPLNMFQTNEETLMIYYYNEAQGFGFLEYLPQEQVVKEVGNFTLSTTVDGFAACEEGYLFFENWKFYYGTLEGV